MRAGFHPGDVAVIFQITERLPEGSQSLVNEGRFPRKDKEVYIGDLLYVSQSLVNEGRFPQKRVVVELTIEEFERVAIPR